MTHDYTQNDMYVNNLPQQTTFKQ